MPLERHLTPGPIPINIDEPSSSPSPPPPPPPPDSAASTSLPDVARAKLQPPQQLPRRNARAENLEEYNEPSTTRPSMLRPASPSATTTNYSSSDTSSPPTPLHNTSQSAQSTPPNNITKTTIIEVSDSPNTNTTPLVLRNLPSRSRRDLMRESIRRLQRSDWVSLEGLCEVATQRLGKYECTAISELGCGSHNSLYQLDFSDGTSCAASISNSPPAFFSVDAKESEVATMQYILHSKQYNIPIPRVLAWDFTFENPVGAPYILREVVKGVNMSEDGKFYKLSPTDKLKIIKELAAVQAELSKPTEFTQIGCIYGNPEEGFRVGRTVSLPSGSPEEDERRKDFLGPYDTLPELWEARIERETLSAISKWSHLPSDDALPSHLPSSRANPQEFGELLQLLSGLTNIFTPPKSLSGLCIHHSDLAIRNVLFDPTTLKITGVIDWEFAAVMPLVMTGRFPNDLGWEGNEFAQSLGKLGDNATEGNTWMHHYYDWTSLSGVAPSKLKHDPANPALPPSPLHHPPPSPPASPAFFTEDYLTTTLATRNPDGATTPSPPSPPLPAPPTAATSQQDLTTRASNLVRLFYYRKYYASRLAARDFALTRLFIDSVAYIKFNEVVMGGAEKWFASAEWIREVYARLSREPRESWDVLRRGDGVIRVPEVFKKPEDGQQQDRRGIDRALGVVDLALA